MTCVLATSREHCVYPLPVLRVKHCTSTFPCCPLLPRLISVCFTHSLNFPSFCLSVLLLPFLHWEGAWSLHKFSCFFVPSFQRLMSHGVEFSSLVFVLRVHLCQQLASDQCVQNSDFSDAFCSPPRSILMCVSHLNWRPTISTTDLEALDPAGRQCVARWSLDPGFSG